MITPLIPFYFSRSLLFRSLFHGSSPHLVFPPLPNWFQLVWEELSVEEIIGHLKSDVLRKSIQSVSSFVNEGMSTLAAKLDVPGEEWTASVLRDAMDAGAFDVAVGVMKKYERYPEVLTSAMTVVWFLLRDDENVAIVAKSAGLHTLISTLSAQPEAAELQAIGCRSLGSIAAMSSEFQPLLISRGSITHVVNALRSHMKDPAVADSASAALATLSATGDGREEVLRAGAVPLLAEAMTEHIASPDVQYSCAAALSHLALESKEAAESIGRCGGVAALCTALGSFHGSQLVVDSVCRGLANLISRAPANAAVALRSGAVDCIVAAGATHLEDVAVTDSVLRAITNLARHPEAAAALAVAGALIIILKSLKTHVTRRSIQLAGCAALGNLSSQCKCGGVV